MCKEGVVTEDVRVASNLRARLAHTLGEQRFALWFGEHTRFRLEGNCLTVISPDAFLSGWLRRNFADDIGACCVALAGPAVTVEFDVDETIGAESVECANGTPAANGDEKGEVPAALTAVPPATSTSGSAAANAKHRKPRSPESKAGSGEPSFASFAVGKCNEYAFTAATMTARGMQQASPILFCGPTSVGKTHLLRSLRAEFQHLQPRGRAVYLTAEQFTTNFVEAVRGTGLPSFRHKCRGADLLLVDDLQFFIGKRASLVELLHTLDTVQADGRRIALASDRTLSELRPLGKELISRLAGGLVCEIQPPVFATRLEIVLRLSREMAIDLSDEIAALVAGQISAGARELRGALHRLQAVSVARKSPITRELASGELAELAQHSSLQVRVTDVEQAVCAVFGVEPAALRSDRKARSVNEPRMLAMWLARKYTRAPWSEIGQHFGRRSHSTVIAAHKRVDALIRTQAAIGVSRETCGVEEAIRRVESAMRSA